MVRGESRDNTQQWREQAGLNLQTSVTNTLARGQEVGTQHWQSGANIYHFILGRGIGELRDDFISSYNY